MIRVRPEGANDAAAIRAVVAAAFGRADEAELVDRLRADGDGAVSLVADDGDAVVGHVMLSTMTAPFRALALAPISVVPARQGQGIGSSLIRAAIETARADGWQGVFVLGDQAYYNRVGFDVVAAQGFASPFAGHHFALQSFTPRTELANGAIEHAAAFFA